MRFTVSYLGGKVGRILFSLILGASFDGSGRVHLPYYRGSGSFFSVVTVGSCVGLFDTSTLK